MKPKLIERSDRYICGLTGNEFSHDGSQSGKAAAIEKLTAHQTQALAKLQQPPKASARKHFFGEEVKHPETRSSERTPGLQSSELSRAKTTFTPGPPGPPKPVNPFDGAFQRKVERLGYNWGQSPAGREERAKLKKRSKEWEAEQERKQQQTAFVESVRPAVDHATKVLDDLRRDPSITVAELEQAQARVQLARDGRLEEYSAADREWRETQKRKLEDAAVEVDSQIRTLAAKRDTILAEAFAPVNEAAEPQLVPVSYPDFYHDPAKAGKTIMEPMPQ